MGFARSWGAETDSIVDLDHASTYHRDYEQSLLQIISANLPDDTLRLQMFRNMIQSQPDYDFTWKPYNSAYYHGSWAGPSHLIL